MAGLREQKKAETRKAIIDSSIQLFTEKGFEKTSIEDIAKQAGIGKATVYTYFATKDDIFLTFCSEELEDAFATLQTPRKEDDRVLDQLVDFFMLKFKFVTKNSEFGRQLLREMLFPKKVNNKVKEHNQRYFDILEKLFKSAQDRGELPPAQDLFLLSVHFFSLYLGVLVGWYGGYVASLEEAEEAMRNLFGHVFMGVGL
ncbi:MAG: TetR/AcrR family transcriptional regulator [Deltaproteobacteria bacterium]|nr:TetR/AcrR family transcriptional regulator [Deltaproteobacteria bacterium]